MPGEKPLRQPLSPGLKKREAEKEQKEIALKMLVFNQLAQDFPGFSTKKFLRGHFAPVCVYSGGYSESFKICLTVAWPLRQLRRRLAREPLLQKEMLSLCLLKKIWFSTTKHVNTHLTIRRFHPTGLRRHFLLLVGQLCVCALAQAVMKQLQKAAKA